MGNRMGRWTHTLQALESLRKQERLTCEVWAKITPPELWTAEMNARIAGYRQAIADLEMIIKGGG